ncbi:MAG: hypothetical protein HN404_20265 [Gemmatimonadetes bacterium]|nr:hypothetical protein [Gemmatimonadota bacterium]
MTIDLSDHFPRYTDFDPTVPVWCVTPETDGCYHRFFDTSPVSPSGRYLGVTRMRHEDRAPQPGDSCDIVVVDLQEGTTHLVAESRGWDTQLGAQVQWGADDTQLFFNDMDCDTWKPFGVVMDPIALTRRHLDGTVYMASRDGREVASPCLLRMSRTQSGYGVLAPEAHVPTNEGAPTDDGLSVTDVATGSSRLLASIADIVESVLDISAYEGGDFYGFHVKWNPTGDRLMFVLRWVDRAGEIRRNPNAITMRADGSDMAVCFSDEIWNRGGHHPDWAPDGLTGTINLKLDSDRLSLVRAKADGSDLAAMTSVQGSGHPSLHPNGRQIVTDVYLHEKLAYGDGTTPIRWIDTETDTEEVLVRINNDPPFSGDIKQLRIDPHPAWDRSYRYITFNGCDQGVRRVYVADLQSKIHPPSEPR